MANTLKWPALKYQGPQLDPKTVQARTDKALRLAAGQHSTTAPLGQLPYTPQFGMPPMGSAMPYMGAPSALQPPQQGLQPQQGIQPGAVPMPGFAGGGEVDVGSEVPGGLGWNLGSFAGEMNGMTPEQAAVYMSYFANPFNTDVRLDPNQVEDRRGWGPLGREDIPLRSQGTLLQQVRGYAEGGDVEFDPDEEQRQRDAERMANPQAFAGTSTAPGPPAPIAGPPVPSYADNVQAMASQLTPQQINDAGKEAMAAGVYDQTLPVLRDLQAGVMTQGEKGLVNPTPQGALNPNAQAGSIYRAQEDVPQGSQGTLRGALLEGRQGQSQYGAIPQAIARDPVGIAATVGLGIAPQFLGGPGLLSTIARQAAVGLAANRPFTEAAEKVPGYNSLPEAAKATIQFAPWVAGGGGSLLTKGAGAVIGGAGGYYGNKLDEAIGAQVPGVGIGPFGTLANLAGGAAPEGIPALARGLEGNAVKGLEFRPQAPAIQEGSTAAQNILRANRAEAGIAGGAPKPMSPEDAVSFFRSQGMSDADIAAFTQAHAPRGAGPDYTANLNTERNASQGAAANTYQSVLERTGDPGIATKEAARAAALEGQLQRDIQTGKQTGIEDVRGPAPEETVRLYRAEATPGSGKPMPEWLQQGREQAGLTNASGRWFTDDPVKADWYMQDSGPNARMTYVDVPKSQLEQFKVANNPDVVRYSLDPKSEYFLPREMADSRRPLAGGGQANGPIAASPPPASLPAQADRTISPPLPGPNPFEAPPRPMPASAIGQEGAQIAPTLSNRVDPLADRAISRPLAGANPFEAPPRPLPPETGTGVPGGRIDELMQKAPGVQFADTAGMSNQELLSEAKRLGVPVDEGLITRGLPEGRNQELAKIQTALDAETDAKFGNMNRAERDYFEQLRAERGAGSTPASDFINSQNGINSQAERVRGGIVPPDQMPPGATTAGNAMPPPPPNVNPNAWQQAQGVLSFPLNTLFAGGHMFRQGVGAAVTHPGEAATALRGFALALVNPEGKVALQQSVRDAGEALAAGHRLSDMKALSGATERVNPTFAEKVAQKIPLVGKLKDGGMTYLGLLRDGIYSNAAAKLERLDPGASPKMFTDLYATVSHNTGHMTGRNGVQGIMGTAQGLGLGPSAVVARFQALADPFIKSGGPIPFVNAGARAEAIRSLLGNAGVIAATGAVGSALGGNVNLPFGDNAKGLLNPYGIETSLFKATFNSDTGYKTTYSGGAGYDTMIKLFGNAAIDLERGDLKALQDHLLGWGRGQAGPIPAKVIDLLYGSDWQDKPYNLDTLKGEAKDGFWRSWAPLAAQSMKDAYDGWGPQGIAMALPSVGAYEVSTHPRTPSDLASDYTNDPRLPEAIRGQDYQSLGPDGKAAVNALAAKDNPAAVATVKEAAAERANPAMTAYHDAKAQIDQQTDDRKTQIYELLRDGKITGDQAKQLKEALYQSSAAKTEAARNDPEYKKALADLPAGQQAEVSKALSAYYSIDKAVPQVNGKPDYDRIASAQKAFLEAIDKKDAETAKLLRFEVNTKPEVTNPLDKLYAAAQPIVEKYFRDTKDTPTSKASVERVAMRRANPGEDALLNLLGYERGTLTPQAGELLTQLRSSLPAAGAPVAGGTRGNSVSAPPQASLTDARVAPPPMAPVAPLPAAAPARAPIAASATASTPVGAIGPDGRTVAEIAGTPYKSDAERNFYFESRGLPIPAPGSSPPSRVNESSAGATGNAYTVNAQGKTPPITAADIAPVAQKYGVPPGPFALLMNHEGNGAHDTSEKGFQPARWGIVETTAKQYGINDTRNMTPQQAYDIAGQYLNKGMEANKGDPTRAFASYFIGQGGVDKAVAGGGDWVKNADQIAYNTLINGQHVYGAHSMTDFLNYLGLR